HPSHEAAAALSRSYVALAHGELAAAREAAEGALGRYEELGQSKMVWRSRVQLAAVLAEFGKGAEAASVLPAPSSRTELQDIVYDASAQIRSRLVRGELDEALELAREIAGLATDLAVYRDALASACEALVAGGDLASA